MSFNHLTIQSLQATRQRSAYAGLSGLGETKIERDTYRPSFDYVRAGDVIRIALFLDAVFSAPPIPAFRSALGGNTNLRLIRIDQSQLSSALGGYSGTLIVDVQPLGDFNKLDDVVRLVAGVAQGAGLSVLSSSTRGEFVSKVETSGGATPSTIPEPNNTSTPAITDSFTNFFNGLTQSPVTLAVILGAVVVLVIAAKK